MGIIYSGLTSSLYGPTGITDRYSLIDLWAIVGDAAHHVSGYNGFSGSLHEIFVDGKVIAGAPSRAGIQFAFSDTSELSPADMNQLENVFYHDPTDPDADGKGNVYFYDPEADNPYNPTRDPDRNARVAAKFIAYNTQPNRVFWLKMSDGDPLPLTYFDETTQRWTVHPDAPQIFITRGSLGSKDRQDYFWAFDTTSGIGIEVVGTSIAYEGVILPPGIAPWSVYFGPTVREITVLGDDALVAGGELYSGGAAMWFGPYAHVGSVLIGDSRDVKNLSDVLFVPNNLDQTSKNFRAFDTMTSIKRSKLLYDSNLLFDEDENHFHFDNAGVHGDIVANFNAVAYLFGGSGTVGNATWTMTYGGAQDPFWSHSHPGPISYNSEILNLPGSPGIAYTPIWNSRGNITTSTAGPSFLVGHRDLIGSGYGAASGWTAAGIPGRSLILDEILLYFLVGEMGTSQAYYDYAGVLRGLSDSYGYGDSPQHFHEALARFLYHTGYGAETLSGLSVKELLAGYTRDGTLLIFKGGDIFSGHIYGGGFGDYYNPQGGNIDLRLLDGTTIFNRNMIEFVDYEDRSKIVQAAGVRVRDLYVEKTGHLLMNDAVFAVDPFVYGTPDYASRLIIHDVYNEGIVSGNGEFQIAERQSPYTGTTYFDGNFVNRGVLAPGLMGLIGENEHYAEMLEQKAYQKMLGDPARFVEWDMKGTPGGQYGAITIFGNLYLMDEITRPVYDPSNPLYNTDEDISAGEYHVTVGNDTIQDMFNKYANAIANATPTYDPVLHTYDTSKLKSGEISKEDWKIIAVEKLGTHLSWFSPSAMVDKNGMPLLTDYEVFEYMTDPKRRKLLQDRMIAEVLSDRELRDYKNNPARQAELNAKMLAEFNIRLELTPTDALLMRYGFSDVVSVHGTIPPYYRSRAGWRNDLIDWTTASNADRILYLGTTQLGGVIQADRIYDTDSNADKKDKQTSFIIIASEAYKPGSSIQQITSDTTEWVYANVDVLDVQLASGQMPAVLTLIDDKNYYRNRVGSVKHSSFNAKSVAQALDKAMFTNPGLAQSFQFGMNEPDVLNNVLRQVASGTRANSVMMNMSSPSDSLFSNIGYGVGGLSTGGRGDTVFRNIDTGHLEQPYGQAAVPPPGQQYAPPMNGQYRGQSPFHRTGSVWGVYTNSTFSMGDDNNSFKYSFSRNGAMVGSEWNLTPSSVLGGVAMFNEGNLQSLSDKVKSQDYVFGIYLVAAPFEQFEVKSFMGAGFQAYKTDRYITDSKFFGGNTADGRRGINEHYDSETQGQSFNYSVEFARPFTVNPNFVIRPAAGFEYQNIMQNAYSERKNQGAKYTFSGSASNLAANHEVTGASQGTYAGGFKSMTFARTMVRYGFNTESYYSRGGIRFRAYYVGLLTGDKYPVSRQYLTSGSDVFKVRGGELGNGYVQVGMGTNLWLNQERTTSLFFNGDWNFSMVNRGYSMLNLNTGIMVSF
jgi:hypothetical protein